MLYPQRVARNARNNPIFGLGIGLAPSPYQEEAAVVNAAHVQHTQNQYASSSSARTLAFPSNVTAGNFLVAAVTTYDSSTVTTTLTDSLSQTWSVIGPARYSTQNTACWLYYYPNTLGGANTVTVTPNATVLMSIIVAEFSGVGLVSPLQQSVTVNNSQSQQSVYVGPIGQPTTPNISFVAVGFSGATASWCLPDSGYSMLGQLTIGLNNAGGFLGFKVNEVSDYGMLLTTDVAAYFAGVLGVFSG
jgi:hypothetical protein